MAKLEDLVLRITADSRQLRRELGRVESRNNQISKSIGAKWRGLSGTFGGITSRVGALGAGLAALGSGLAVAGIDRQVDRFEEMADSIDKTSQKLDVGVETLQNWRFAAELAGVGANTFDMALQRFIRRSGEAALGTGEARGALRELGVELRDGQGNIRKSEELFQDAIRALGRLEDATTRTAVAQKLFDSEGVALVNLATNFDELVGKAEELGVAIDEDVIRSLVRTKDEAAALGAQLDQRLSTSMSKLAILSLAIKKGFVDAVASFSDTIDESKLLREAFENITPVQLLDDLDVVARRIVRAQDAIANLNREIASYIQNAGAGTPAAVLEQGVGALQKRIAAASQELVDLQARQAELQNPTTPDARAIPTISSLSPDDKAATQRAKDLARAQRELNSILEAGRSPAERLSLALASLTKDYEAGLISLEDFEAGQASIAKQFDELAEKTSESASRFVIEIESLSNTLVDNFSDALARMLLEGELTFEALAQSFAQSFLSTVINQTLTSGLPRLFSAFTGAGVGGGGAGIATSFLGSGTEIAGALASTPAFPTSVPTAPIVAQPAALASTAAAAPAPVSVSVINQTGSEARVTETQGPNGLRQIEVLIEDTVASSIARGGTVGRSLDRRYGTRPRGS